jgi:hypothetical protein
MEKQIKIDVNRIPRHELDRLAHGFLKMAEKFFEDPKVQKEFAEWQAARRNQEAAHGTY